jgi:hypothetical protein
MSRLISAQRGFHMQITQRGIRPCSFCLRARRIVKDGLGRVFQRPATHIEYHTADAVLLVEVATGKIIGAPAAKFHLLERKVTAAKGKLTDASGKKIATYTRTRKLHLPGKVGDTDA